MTLFYSVPTPVASPDTTISTSLTTVDDKEGSVTEASGRSINTLAVILSATHAVIVPMVVTLLLVAVVAIVRSRRRRTRKEQNKFYKITFTAENGGSSSIIDTPTDNLSRSGVVNATVSWFEYLLIMNPGQPQP